MVADGRMAAERLPIAGVVRPRIMVAVVAAARTMVVAAEAVVIPPAVATVDIANRVLAWQVAPLDFERRFCFG